MPKVKVSLRSIYYKNDRILNFRHFSSLLILAHLLLKALFIGLKLYHRVLSAFFKIASIICFPPQADCVSSLSSGK
jgi:hypothetical protein